MGNSQWEREWNGLHNWESRAHRLHEVIGTLIAIGNAFHNRGPTTLNERSPKLTSFVRGTSNRCCCEERVRPVEHCLFSMSARYRGAVPLMHRNNNNNNINNFYGA